MKTAVDSSRKAVAGFLPVVVVLVIYLSWLLLKHR